jgi:hypothetical protein
MSYVNASVQKRGIWGRTAAVILPLLCLTSESWALGPFSIGVRGGLPLTDMFEASGGRYDANTLDFVFGPTVGLNFPHRVSVEADALYKRFYTGIPVSGTTTVNEHGYAWEIPIMLRYRLTGGFISPVLGVGPSFRRTGGYGDLASTVTGGTSSTSAVIDEDNNHGIVAGAGVRFNFYVVKITPEFRYTRWFEQNINSAAVGGGLYTKKDQMDIIVGLTF